VASWNNWSGRQRAKPQSVQFVRSEADAVAVVMAAGEERTTVRVAGAGHSHAPLVPSAGFIVDTSGLAGVVSTDVLSQRARVWAGTRIYALGRPLHDAGLALANQGDIDRQAIAGATATGTHGTGEALKNLSAGVAGARIVVASGEIVECSPEVRPEVWQAARLNLGALGIVTKLELQLRDAYRLQERGWTASFDELFPQIPELIGATRHFEFFWYPESDEANAKTLAETDAEAVYPLAEEGSRLAWSYEVLPNHRPHLHTEMEYSVPAANGPECAAQIRDLIRTDFPEVRWPVEYRTLAADDVWLSTAYERDTVTISVHLSIDEDETAYYRACEEIFRSFDGRPHWGKVNYLDGATLAEIHPRWADWWRVRDEVDPGGVFLNDYLRSIRPR
jgi:FAD/FMN-containing dehydrogenase